MKLAVLTNHQRGIDLSHHLDELEINVTLFWQSTSDIPATKWKHPHRVITEKVLWVQKQALAPGELLGKARMKDLFRVVYEKKGSVSADLPLSDEMKKSLLEPVDAFEDVDAIIVVWDIEHHDHYAHPSMAPALGELRLKKNACWFYESIASQRCMPATGELALIGQSEGIFEKLSALLGWLVDASADQFRRVFWVTHLENPWDIVDDIANPKLKEKILKLKNQLMQKFENKIVAFEIELNKWRELPEYEKAKHARPEDPIDDLVIFAGHHLSSVDQMLEQEKLYLTIETAHWREVVIQKENSRLPLKTISVDEAYIYQGMAIKTPWENYIDTNEPGHLNISANNSLENIIASFKQKIIPFFQVVS